MSTYILIWSTERSPKGKKVEMQKKWRPEKETLFQKCPYVFWDCQLKSCGTHISTEVLPWKAEGIMVLSTYIQAGQGKWHL